MTDAKQFLFAKNLITVCIDSTENADFQGRIWHQYSDDPIEFETASEMMITMDELMDEWDFPQKGMEQRSFSEKKKHPEKRASSDDELVIDKIASECGTRNIQNKRGKLASFVIHVAFRQNATWQGQVVIAESDEKKDFESELELLGIMQDALKLH